MRCPIKKCVLHIDYLKNIPKKCGCASRIFQFILAMDGKTTIFLWERLLGSQEQLWRYFQMECWQNTSGEPTLMLRIDGMMFVLHRHSEQKQHTTMQKSVVMQVSVCRTRSNVLIIIKLACFSSIKNKTRSGGSLSLTCKKSMDISSFSYGSICLGHCVVKI